MQRHRPVHTSGASDGSRTLTIHDVPTPESGGGGDAGAGFTGQQGGDGGLLRLRGSSNVANRRVIWAQDTVDNEGLGRKKSKICCIYHKPRAFDESSSDSSSGSDSSSEADSDSESPSSAASSESETDGPSLSQAMKDKVTSRKKSKGKGKAASQGQEHGEECGCDHTHDSSSAKKHRKRSGKASKMKRSGGRTMVITEPAMDDQYNEGDGEADSEADNRPKRNAYETGVS